MNQSPVTSTPSAHAGEPLHPLSATQVASVVIAVVAALWAVHWSRVFLIPPAVAVCMTFWLMPLVDGLQRLRVPRMLGAALVLAALIGGIGAAGYVLRDDARGFAADLSVATKHARSIFNKAARDPNGWLHHVRTVLGERTATGVGKERPAPPAVNAPDIEEAVVKGSTKAMEWAAQVGVVLLTMYLMLASGDMFKRKLVSVIAQRNVEGAGALGRKRITVEIVNEIALQFQRYLGVLAITNIAIGLVIWATFAALGVQHAAVWGAAAAILHIIPYLGPAIVAVASFFVTDSPRVSKPDRARTRKS